MRGVVERKLLAVVAADMVGFSRLIEDDEINLLSRQKNQLNTIIKPEIENFNGEIIKTTGDGFLAIFPSALDAVQSSISIQNGIYENELDNANDKRIRFRIGIHVGDVVLDDGDIFGNTVNIASRLESIADAGNICITNDVYQSIKNLKPLDIENIGEQFLKNISQKVQVYKINIFEGDIKKIQENHLLTEANQETRFCSSFDGTIIAYASIGKGTPFLKAPNFVSSLEHDWRNPMWTHMYRFLAKEYTLYRFDQRGNGLSDLDPENINFESFVKDMEAVVNNSQINKFPIFGISQGCSVSIAYAHKYPEKVTHLILVGGYARGRAKRGNSDYNEKFELEKNMILNGWENENPAFRQFFSSTMIPDGTKEQMNSFNNVMKVSTSAKNAVKIISANDQIDVSGLLPKLNIPTIIFHIKNDARVPISESKFMAANIKNSKFVPLNGNNHVILENDEGWPIFQKELKNFLK